MDTVIMLYVCVFPLFINIFLFFICVSRQLRVSFILYSYAYFLTILCLKFQIEAHLDTLINEQASYVLTRAGLSYIYNSVQQHKPEQVR